MFIGHFAVALTAQKTAPKTSLGTLILAAQFPDLLWPILLILGVERVAIAPGDTAVTPLAFVDYPFSHSLIGVFLAGAALGTVYWAIKNNTQGAVVLGLVVLSHWLLDAATHRPDLPLYPGSSVLIGFGLWNSRGRTLLVEGAFFLASVLVYLHSTRAKDRKGNYAFWAFIVFLVATYFGNLFGPPPPCVGILEVSGLGIWLLVAWGFWIDRHREARV